MSKIKVENTEISVVNVQNEDYISLTDMAHSQMQEHIIFRWMSLKSTIEYLGEWEMLYNPNFNCTEFDTIRNAAGRNLLKKACYGSKEIHTDTTGDRHPPQDRRLYYPRIS